MASLAATLVYALATLARSFASADDVQPVYDVLSRTLGNASGAAVCRAPPGPPGTKACPQKDCLICFDLKLDASMAQGFTLSSDGGLPITVAVTASSLPELSYGAAVSDFCCCCCGCCCCCCGGCCCGSCC